METIWYFFYNIIVIPLLFITIRLTGLFNKKIQIGISGRKRIFENLLLNASLLEKNKKLIWFHSSSLGEFEQAKPIIQELKKRNNVNILITFFSPSGYENSKKYPYADLVSYIPFDSISNAKKLISIAKPDLNVIMRYDIWPNHIWAMAKFQVPIFVVDATMKLNSPRTLPFSKNFHKNLFRLINKFLAVSENDVEGFKEFEVSSMQLKAVGDTRFDRVYQRSIIAKAKNLIKSDFLAGKKIFVAGSTWEVDEDVILPAFTKLTKYDNDVVMIIAPHEPTLAHLERIENELEGSLETIRFSFLNNYRNEKIIIVDSIGILLTLYTYADLAFVGGSFKQGIHNVLEAAVYGIPVIFGPKIDNSQESKQLLKRGSGILIRNKAEAYRQLRMMFSNEVLRKAKGKISAEYVKENLGATEKILEEIHKVI